MKKGRAGGLTGRQVAVLLAVSDEEELERLVLANTPKFKALLDSA